MALTDLSEGGTDPAVGLEMAIKDGQPIRKADLQQHLQSMFALLPPHHVLKEVVRLESAHRQRIRYLAVVACCGSSAGGCGGLTDEEEACVLGFDCIGDKATTLGLALALYADSGLTLDGDGGFSLSSGGAQHVFKPVSVHVLWAVLQSLHKACDRAQKYNHYAGGATHQWIENYRITSSRSCLNEWNYLPDVESRRPSSPLDQKADRERLIRSTLKDVMMTLDLDVVTSKDIRRRVEEEIGLDLTDQKSFLDQEMLIILGQMDGASRIFDDLYLGSEWNASNLEELERNGIGHILNVTREIDNFFPDQFDYLNVRVYDDEATELLKHWDRTYKYIRRAVESGSKVLVHCKMGVSRSASVVIAYAMKARHWDLAQAMKHVKERRACVKPNASFMHQLEIYAGILGASRQRHNSLWRSKSETNLLSKQGANLQSQQVTGRTDQPPRIEIETGGGGHSLPDSRDSPSSVMDAVDGRAPIQQEKKETIDGLLEILDNDMGRPKSWSPDDSLAESYFPVQQPQQQVDANQESEANRSVCVSLRVPCSNGRTYSVSQNRAVQLESSPLPPPPPQPCFSLELGSSDQEVFECVNTALLTASAEPVSSLPRVGSVKDRIYELEVAWGTPPGRQGLALNLTSQFENASAACGELSSPLSAPILPSSSPPKPQGPARHQSVPAGRRSDGSQYHHKSADVFSSSVDRVFEREERRQANSSIHRDSPHRQHSWGSAETKTARTSSKGQSTDSPSVAHRTAHSASPVATTKVMSSSTCRSPTAACRMPSYASDPSLPTSELVEPCSQPPLGLVRMQREALENMAIATNIQQRRSLPDETPVPQPPQLSRSVSETASGSVMRLRRELEAKGLPLTGSFAPPPLMAAALAAALADPPPHSPRTSPIRPKTRYSAGHVEQLRKRSFSLERVHYDDSVVADWNSAAQVAVDEVDHNVKLLVGLFETPAHRPTKMERPRGWSESSSYPRPNAHHHSNRRQSSSAKPPVPSGATGDGSVPAHCSPPRPLAKERKLYGKTHPLDRLASNATRQKLAQPVFGTM